MQTKSRSFNKDEFGKTEEKKTLRIMKSWLCKYMYLYDNKSNASSFDP